MTEARKAGRILLSLAFLSPACIWSYTLSAYHYFSALSKLKKVELSGPHPSDFTGDPIPSAQKTERSAC
jgi:hypothetical protein